MSDPTRPSPDPFGGLDPEVWRILAEQDAAAAGGGTGAADPTAVARPAPGGGASSAEVDFPGAGSPGDPAGARRAALGAALAWAILLAVAAVADPSGLAAPIAWSGASPTAAPWAWLQYVLYGPLMVVLVWVWMRALLRAAIPAAPRGWVFSRTWLGVVVAAMVAKLAYSVVLLAPALVSGSEGGLPADTSLPYLVWATGVTGVKALLFGWVPAVTAAVLWRPGPSRAAGMPSRVAEPTLSLLPAAVVALVVALVGGWLADLWWTGSPVGYAYSTDWRLLAPTVATGRVGQLAALALFWLLLAGSVTATLRRVPVPRPAGALRLAGAAGTLAAGLGLAVVQSIVAALFGTDLPGGGDLWIVPSTYLRLVEGLSFGLLVAPVAVLAMWLVPRAPRPQVSWVAAVAAVAVLVGMGVVVTRQGEGYDGVPPLASDPQPVSLPQQPGRTAGEPAAPERITVRRDADGSAVLADQAGAQVVLRGINVNQLGEYYQANPAVPAVAPLTEQDLADIAAMGFDVVRLILSWSRVQPQSGSVDEEYLAQVRQAVGWAGAHGIHVVLDMHQDAWGMSVVAPEGTTCRSGTSPMTGWDGAPDWATYFDGAAPCQFTGRDLAPNVMRAFTSFYLDRSDIESQLVSSWGRIAEEFGGEPTVVGYDLLNEPSFAEQAPLTSGMLLGRYHARAIQAIRTGEAKAADGYAHPVFLEPSIWWSGFGLDPLPPRGFTTDSQVVFAPHLYNESITMDQSLGVHLVGLERGWALAERAAANWGSPLWVGEWGIWRDEEANRRYYERFMAQADAAVAGTAMWQWKQACGDPHSYPSEESGNVRRMSCPDGSPLPTRTEELEPVTRAYPRSAPGRLESIESTDSALRITGSTSGVGAVDGTPDTCSLDVWVPGEAEPAVGEAVGVTGISTVRVPEGSAPQDPSGGWRVLGCATGDWALTVS